MASRRKSKFYDKIDHLITSQVKLQGMEKQFQNSKGLTVDIYNLME